MKLLTAAFSALTLIALVTGPSSRALAAGPPCGEADGVLANLKTGYGEKPAFAATADGTPIVITVGPSGTWTLMAMPNAETLCVLAGGKDWAAKAADAAPTPETQSLPAAPALLPNGLLLISR